MRQCDGSDASRTNSFGTSDPPQPAIHGKRITASFVVTEVQTGDTPETMLHRADRVVYQAKEMDRDTVVQLGGGISGEEKVKPARWWSTWLSRRRPDTLLERTLVTSVPLNVAIEKLRGFVADHDAEILSVEGNRVLMNFEGKSSLPQRRRGDRSVPFVTELSFDGNAPPHIAKFEAPWRDNDPCYHSPEEEPGSSTTQRDWDRARQLLTSLTSYLMAHEASSEEETADP